MQERVISVRKERGKEREGERKRKQDAKGRHAESSNHAAKEIARAHEPEEDVASNPLIFRIHQLARLKPWYHVPMREEHLLELCVVCLMDLLDELDAGTLVERHLDGPPEDHHDWVGVGQRRVPPAVGPDGETYAHRAKGVGLHARRAHVLQQLQQHSMTSAPRNE